MEEQILPYYLKIFSTFFIITLIFFIYFIFINQNQLQKNIISIKKGDNLESVIKNNVIKISKIELFTYKVYYRIFSKVYDNIHYGDFSANKNINFYDLITIITKPSNILKKITIIEGWSKEDLNNELSKYFETFQSFNFSDILANTYYISPNESFEVFKNKLKIFKKKYLQKYHNHELLRNYSEYDILIIGSLIEKEGLDYLDKQNISSVIFNRLNKNMRLQIDATVLFAVTNGNYNLKRALNFKDLKFKSEYNTYLNFGLPPGPISYVGSETIDIIFSGHKTDYLFYFFDKDIKKHIFTKNYKNHLKKLNEYKKQK